jgi:hypothetical protein
MAFFKTNIGTPERLFRALLGIAILSLAVVGPRSPWGYVGIVPLLTALLGWCPLYRILGISTVRKEAA